MDANQLVKVYIKIRDAKYAKERQMEEEIAALEQQLEVVEHELLEICKATGQDGGKTQYGSFTRYWTSDWDSMYKFIKDYDVPQILERRISQGVFKEFLNENPGFMPAGVNQESKYSITVRRSSK